MILTSWLFWMISAVVLGILEVLAPGFILLGFAIGAAVMGAIFFFAPEAVSLSPSVAVLVFSVLSVLSWAALRRIFGLRKSNVKIWEKDINDDV